MVRRGGRSRLGCLFTALVFATLLYYGVGIGGVYVRYWQLADQMNQLATLAPSLDDATIRRRLVLKATDLGLPEAAHHFVIRRYDRAKFPSSGVAGGKDGRSGMQQLASCFHPRILQSCFVFV